MLIKKQLRLSLKMMLTLNREADNENFAGTFQEFEFIGWRMGD